MTHKSFAVQRRAATGETVSFDFGDGDTFYCAPDAPGGALLDVASVASDETADGLVRLRALGTFLDQVMLPESRERFEKRMRDAERPITLADAMGVVQWLISEVYAGVPTQPPSSSDGGSPNNGSTSTAGALSAT